MIRIWLLLLSVATVIGAELPLGVIGAVEDVAIVAAKRIYPARIDTGAETTSIDARAIETFERDGEPWVRFQLRPQGDEEHGPSLERPLLRTMRIKQHDHNSVSAHTRPVVELTLIMGSSTLARDVNLVDRSNYEFALLIGRNVLAGQAAVDVSRNHTLDTKLPDSDH
ncbi:MAG: ATP-dependent zinc protease family protein [Planctomycetota bacterium]|jgi:hypothetical protein